MIFFFFFFLHPLLVLRGFQKLVAIPHAFTVKSSIQGVLPVTLDRSSWQRFVRELFIYSWKHQEFLHWNNALLQSEGGHSELALAKCFPYVQCALCFSLTQAGKGCFALLPATIEIEE